MPQLCNNLFTLRIEIDYCASLLFYTAIAVIKKMVKENNFSKINII